MENFGYIPEFLQEVPKARRLLELLEDYRTDIDDESFADSFAVALYRPKVFQHIDSLPTKYRILTERIMNN